MASTFNIKGTSYNSFQIGKEGITIYQGITPPSNGSYVKGDIYFQRGDSSNQPSTWTYNGTSWISEDSTSLPLNLSSGATTISGNGSILNFNVGSTQFDTGTTSFGNTVSFNGTTTFSGNNAPTSSVNISDTPGNTSGKLSTTSWVDQNYASKSSLTTLQTTVTRLSSSSSNSQYVVADPNNKNIGLGFSPTFSGSHTTNSLAIGDSIAIGMMSTAISYGAIAEGSMSLAIGMAARGTASSATSIGYNSVASGIESVSLGINATASTDHSSAIGSLSNVSNGLRSVALGAGSMTTEDDVISVGYGPNTSTGIPFSIPFPQYRRITNVADGINANDAVTLEQLQKYVSNSSNSGNISGIAPSTSSSAGSNATNIYSDSNGNVQYTDTNNGTRQIALASTPKGLINKQIFSTPGQYTYTPTPGTTKIIIKACGAGGGGAGAADPSLLSANSFSVGIGGCGGTYAESTLITSNFSGVQVTVGAGGTRGPTYEPNAHSSDINSPGGGNGGVSSVGTLLTCEGGTGGETSDISLLVPYTMGLVLSGAYSYNSYNTGRAYGNLAYYRSGGAPLPPVVYCPTESDHTDGALANSRGGDSFLSPTSDSFGETTILDGSYYGFDASGYGGGGGGGISYNPSGTKTSYNKGGGGRGGDGIVIIEEYA